MSNRNGAVAARRTPPGLKGRDTLIEKSRANEAEQLGKNMDPAGGETPAAAAYARNFRQGPIMPATSAPTPRLNISECLDTLDQAVNELEEAYTSLYNRICPVLEMGRPDKVDPTEPVLPMATTDTANRLANVIYHLRRLTDSARQVTGNVDL